MNDTPVLSNYLRTIEPENKFYINVGSSYEFNLDRQLINESDCTIFFECDPNKVYNYANLGDRFSIIVERVTPHNLKSLVESKTSRKDPKLLDIDIDGYDWFVVEEFLKDYRPTIILAEINEKIPPPIKFTVKYDDNYSWQNSHFYGASLEKYAELFEKNGYDMINLTYNNVYAVAKEKNPGIETFQAKELFDRYYRNTDRANYFGHNNDVNCWLDTPTETAIQSIKSYFQNREGQFEIS